MWIIEAFSVLVSWGCYVKMGAFLPTSSVLIQVTGMQFLTSVLWMQVWVLVLIWFLTDCSVCCESKWVFREKYSAHCLNDFVGVKMKIVLCCVAAKDVFRLLNSKYKKIDLTVGASFFEIYSGKVGASFDSLDYCCFTSPLGALCISSLPLPPCLSLLPNYSVVVPYDHIFPSLFAHMWWDSAVA